MRPRMPKGSSTEAPLPNPNERRCPYCSGTFYLEHCEVVSTAPSKLAATASQDLDSTLSSPAVEEETEISRGGRPLLRRLSPVTESGVIAPLTSLAGPRESPRRECPACNYLLPTDIDDRRLQTVGIVGAVGAGKTHFIAAALHEATGSPLLSVHGLRSFRPDDETAQRFRKNYWEPFHHDRVALESTPQPQTLEAMAKPLVYRFEFEENRRRGFRTDVVQVPCSVMMHDLPGEMLEDGGLRRYFAPFLSASESLILLVDPLGFAPVRDYITRIFPEVVPADRYNTQAALFNGVADELGGRLSETNVVVVITKADLLGPALDESFSFDKPASERLLEHKAEMAAISSEVEDLLLGRLCDNQLNDALERFNPTMFHAVAAIGSQPIGTMVTELRPKRVLDPLVSLFGLY
jgi:hypothetical protein